MSIRQKCPACFNGDHEHHVRGWGLRPGLIGGQYCPCQGGCRAEWDESVEKMSEAARESRVYLREVR